MLVHAPMSQLTNVVLQTMRLRLPVLCAAHLHSHLRPLHMHFSAQHAMYMHYKTVVHPLCCCGQSVCCCRYGDTFLVATLSKMCWCIMRRMTRCMCTLQSHAMRRSSAFMSVSFRTCHRGDTSHAKLQCALLCWQPCCTWYICE